VWSCACRSGTLYARKRKGRATVGARVCQRPTPVQLTLDSFGRSCARGPAQPREPTTHIPKARLMGGGGLSLLSCSQPPWLANMGLSQDTDYRPLTSHPLGKPPKAGMGQTGLRYQMSASNPRPSPHSTASGVHALVGRPSQESPPLTSQKPG
jgi:hypothetical protein